MKNIILVFILILVLSNPAYAGLFGGGQPSPGVSTETQTNTNDIPIRDEASKIIEKRKLEARKLISEGLELMREGEKKKKESLITKGRIKKEIGEKQLEALKEQAKMKEKEDQSYGW